MPSSANHDIPAPPATPADLAPSDRRVLNEVELARRWGIGVKTLQRWRVEGCGPRYLKLSRRISYPLDSVLAYERFALHDSTSQRTSP